MYNFNRDWKKCSTVSKTLTSATQPKFNDITKVRFKKNTTNIWTMENSRRDFIKKTIMTSAATYVGSIGFSATSYRRILGANDRVSLGVVGFSDRHKDAHMSSFMNLYQELNFDVIAVSDIWKKRREEGS